MKLDASVPIRDRIDDRYRTDSRRVFASLVRLLKDFDLADDAMHESYAARQRFVMHKFPMSFRLRGTCPNGWTRYFPPSILCSTEDMHLAWRFALTG
jgi:hypothetical protein